MATTYEGSVTETDGKWYLSVVIVRHGSEWRSPRALLAATTQEEAEHEGTLQLRRLRDVSQQISAA